MKKNQSMIRKMGMLLMAAFLLATTFTACSSDDVVKTQLETPAVTEGSKTVSSLAFNWQPVAGASQYAYELYDASDKVVQGGVTAATSVVATGLKPNSSYTLKVWAYSPLDSDKTTSPIATLTATTNAKTPLVKPTPTAETGNGGVTISWPAVEHADIYKYSYTVDGEVKTGSVETNSVTLTDLPIGEYTIQIIASSNDENYADSEPISLTFQRTKSELWRADGTYTSVGLGCSFKATIVAYDDGTYTIDKPFGEEGYSISFTVPEGSTEITPVGTASSGYYAFYVSSQYYVSLYTAGGYSEFDGTKEEGDVWFYSYLNDYDGNQVGEGGYDEFTWSEGDDIPEGCKEEVPAMLTTTWGQYAPYWNDTPTKDGKQCLTGCVATSLAQILNYYKYPAQLSDGTVIDWDNMLPSYEEGKYTDAQAAAVALLMARCGEVANMSYGTDVSTSQVSDIESYGFAEKFGYIVKYYGYRDYPNQQDAKLWKEVIFKELSAGHPVLYGGTSYKNGENNYFSHSFVIDGYNSKGLVHVNYGFNGAGDAWVPIDKMPLKTGGWDETFDTYQTLVVIHRPQDGAIDYTLQPQ